MWWHVFCRLGLASQLDSQLVRRIRRSRGSLVIDEPNANADTTRDTTSEAAVVTSVSVDSVVSILTECDDPARTPSRVIRLCLKVIPDWV